MKTEYSYSQPAEIPYEYVKALAELVYECECRGITFKTRFYQNGFQCYQFSCHPSSGDIMIDDTSCGHVRGNWESYGFEWDCDDVTELSTTEFVDALWHHYLQ